jgi:hypothetical protein
MLKTLEDSQRLSNLPETMIAATGSENRRRLLTEVMSFLEKTGLINSHIRVHKLSPDTDLHVNESASNQADLVSHEKAMLIAFALGLIDQDQVPEAMMEGWLARKTSKGQEYSHVMRVSPEQMHINLDQHVGVFGGDVVTLVGTSLDESTNPEEGWEELLKLNREFVEGEDEADRKVTIERDKQKILELYTKRPFFVKYKVGIALLGNDEDGNIRSTTVAWDFLLKFRPIPEQIIKDAYKDGTAHHVGPRIDLANLAPVFADKGFGVFVRNADSEADLWKPVEVEVMRSLVIGGLLPPHMCIDLLANFGQSRPQKEGKIEPEKIKMNISKVQ